MGLSRANCLMFLACITFIFIKYGIAGRNNIPTITAEYIDIGNKIPEETMNELPGSNNDARRMEARSSEASTDRKPTTGRRRLRRRQRRSYRSRCFPTPTQKCKTFTYIGISKPIRICVYTRKHVCYALD